MLIAQQVGAVKPVGDEFANAKAIGDGVDVVAPGNDKPLVFVPCGIGIVGAA